jgi:hypothetical protein
VAPKPLKPSQRPGQNPDYPLATRLIAPGSDRKQVPSDLPVSRGGTPREHRLDFRDGDWKSPHVRIHAVAVGLASELIGMHPTIVELRQVLSTLPLPSESRAALAAAIDKVQAPPEAVLGVFGDQMWACWRCD